MQVVARGSWSLRPYGPGPHRAWARAHRLTDVTFATRREALGTLTALLRTCPPPEPAMQRLERVSAGVYRTPDGRFDVRRRPDGRWTVQCADDRWETALALSYRTLSAVRERLAYYTAR